MHSKASRSEAKPSSHPRHDHFHHLIINPYDREVDYSHVETPVDLLATEDSIYPANNEDRSVIFNEQHRQRTNAFNSVSPHRNSVFRTPLDIINSPMRHLEIRRDRNNHSFDNQRSHPTSPSSQFRIANPSSNHQTINNHPPFRSLEEPYFTNSPRSPNLYAQPRVDFQGHYNSHEGHNGFPYQRQQAREDRR